MRALLALGVSGAAAAPSGHVVAQAARLETRVVANAREVRVIFPPDTAHAWGWSGLDDPTYNPTYEWYISVNGIDGPRTLGVGIARTGRRARDFPSLRSLIAASDVFLCEPGMFPRCSHSGITASVEHGSVVLTLTDSATISALFGMRPARVGVRRSTPEVSSTRPESARVEYVQPQIPVPDSAFRARAARGRRAYDVRVNSISRSINGDRRTLWLPAGDSVALEVEEEQCHYDVCFGRTASADDSAWTVDDSSVVMLRISPPDTNPVVPRFLWQRVHVQAFALRPGRTTLHATLAPSPSDTMPSRTPVPRSLARDIVVTPPIARVELSPHADTAVVGRQHELHVRVIDRAGRVVPGVLVKLTVEHRRYESGGSVADSIALVFHSAGHRTVTASFAGHADTAVVTVIEPSGR